MWTLGTEPRSFTKVGSAHIWSAHIRAYKNTGKTLLHTKFKNKKVQKEKIPRILSMVGENVFFTVLSYKLR